MTQKTGYPSIDRPWLKYYSEEAINAPLPECTMYEYIWQNNKDHLSDIALRYYGAKFSYGQLFDSIKRAAAAFRAMGVKAGDIVTIMSMHTPETIAAIYGLNYLGAVANLVYVSLAPQEIQSTIMSTKSKVLLLLDVVLDKLTDIKATLGIPVVVLSVADSMPATAKLGYRLKAKTLKHDFLTWKAFLAKGSTLPESASDHTAPAVIVYTSGTTGEPKGVVHTNDSMNAQAFQEGNSGFGIKRGARFLYVIPMFLGFGMSKLHLAVYSGVESTLWIELNPNSTAEQLFKCKPNIYVTGPAMIDALLDHVNGDLKPLYCLIGGGGDLPEEKEKRLNRKLAECGATAIYANGYGMTETDATLTASRNDVHKPGSIGVPLFKTNVKVVSTEDGTELPYNQIGELLFSTPSLMRGYYNNLKATEAIISTDEDGVRWIHTGDLGLIDEEGFAFIKGRIKRISYTRMSDGTVMRLFPQRIEDFLNSLPYINGCGVVIKEDDKRINIPVVYLSVTGDISNSEDIKNMIMKEASDGLPEHMQPAAIHILETMPMTQSGKIDYRALEALAGE